MEDEMGDEELARIALCKGAGVDPDTHEPSKMMIYTIANEIYKVRKDANRAMRAELERVAEWLVSKRRIFEDDCLHGRDMTVLLTSVRAVLAQGSSDDPGSDPRKWGIQEECDHE